MTQPYNSRIADKFVVRLLDGMREEIKAISESTHRSMNSQIISWLEMLLEIHKQTGVIPNLDSLRSTAELEAQNRLMRALFLRLLEAGSWHHSAVEFDSFNHHVDGVQFEKEIKEVLSKPKAIPTQLLAQPKAVEISEHGSASLDMLEAMLKSLPKPYGPDLLPPVPQFIPQENMPVFVSSIGRNGVVRHIWIGGTHTRQITMARVEMFGGGCTEVPASDLSAPKP